MIKFTRTQQVQTELTITDDEAAAITRDYLQNVVLGGEGRYIGKDSHVMSWTSWPHGSGTTTDHGEATHVQVMAYGYLQLEKAAAKVKT